MGHRSAFRSITGEIFEFGDWDMLADQLVSSSLDVSRLSAMGQAARERVASRFRNADTVEKTLALYRELLAEGARA